MTPVEEIESILSRWSLPFRAPRPDISISGSPERTAYRMVVEDGEDRLWLLEKIPRRLKPAKLDIIRLIDHLNRRGFRQAVPYCRTDAGDYHVEGEDGLWQLQPFLAGVPLDRPGYAFDGWRGSRAADCLLSFRNASGSFDPPDGRVFFSITAYITHMTGRMAQHNPELLSPLDPILSYLKKSFFPVHDTLPFVLCHGDYHPLNLIWTTAGIRALIDWEFFGLKPEAYDAANMVGCLGMEDPDSLAGDMVLSFLEGLASADFLGENSRRSLLDLTLSIRFAWLAEWLRKHDTEMVTLELSYMVLLMDNREKIKKLWNL